MAGLSAGLALVLAAAAAAQEPEAAPPPARTRAEREQGQALQRLESLRREAFADPLTWRKAVFALLLRLEPAAPDRILPHWDRLAESGEEPDLGNRILFRRRHGLALPPPHPNEGRESVLERALAAWGEHRFEAARALLQEGVRRFPEDPVFEQNLQWLDRRPPMGVDPRAGARLAALVVLSARGAL
ncbi:MAG: hypothetical protein EYC70_03495 [Planctomycetota bacterium]|nr:MAG: hypothetical protein EYC70_03495 [Planctomycetota bacterium]